jgi:Leishmanolysin/PEP-CTERM motif
VAHLQKEKLVLKEKRWHRNATRLGAVALCLTLSLTRADAAFTITLNFDPSVTAPQQAVFNSAKATWESLVTGYQPGISITGITISASIPAIDGVGGILGQAGPTAGVSQGGFVLATTGVMQFDSADVGSMSTPTFTSVILHEMGHVMGFGTLWTNNGVYTNGTGNFTGANALAAYRTEFSQAGALAVPVELGGGAGTANGHWNEVDGGGGLTGIVNGSGRDMRDELMTGWLNSNAFISNMTVMSFRDIGFTTVNLAAAPEPGTISLLALGLLGLVAARRRRSVP